MNSSFQFPKEQQAKATATFATISTKASVEIAKYLRYKKVDHARRILERVLKGKEAIPYTRFTDGVGHRTGRIANGRYPMNACKTFLELLNSVEANASNKGLGGNLKIVHLAAQNAGNQFRYGRQRRRTMKRTHVEIVVEELEEKKRTPAAKKAAPAKEAKKETPKTAPVKEDTKAAVQEEKPKTEAKEEKQAKESKTTPKEEKVEKK